MRPPEQRERLLAREFLASALYVDLVLLAAVVAVPEEDLPSDRDIVLLMLGTTIGLVAAHWFSFQLAAHVTTEGGTWERHASEEAAAEVAGGIVVVVLASLPYLLAEGDTAHDASLFVLAALPSITGLAIGRARRLSWTASILTALAALVVSGVVVVIKIASGH